MLQQQKLVQAKEMLKNSEVDIWMTIGRETTMNNDPVIPFLCPINFGGNTVLAITKNEKSIVIANHLDASAFEQMGIYDEVITYHGGNFKEAFIELVKRENPSKIALNFSKGDVASDGLSTGMYLNTLDYLKEANFTGEVVPSETIIGMVRGFKTEEELKAINKAVDITNQIFEDAKGFIRAGLSQIDIHKWFVERTKFYGAETSWEEEHCPGVMLGPDTVMGHNFPTDLTSKPGDAITVDFGVLIDDYCSDIQRVYYILEEGETEAPEEVQTFFNAVKGAVDKGMEAMKPGVPVYLPDQEAREYFMAQGYPDFPFGFGHQVGRKTHDGGASMGKYRPENHDRANLPILENMVFTVDVNAKSSRGYIGQEDMVVVTKDGVKLLGKRQEEIFCVPAK